MAITKESTPPPVIGKAGRYTVFLTPPAIPKPSETVSESPKIQSPKKVVLPPVQPPPQRFDKLSGVNPSSNSSVLGFFWNAVAKVQNAHSSLDECLADWLGLNHSKYQWALDDYYENKGMCKGLVGYIISGGISVLSNGGTNNLTYKRSLVYSQSKIL